jgi:hypothetical protein
MTTNFRFDKVKMPKAPKMPKAVGMPKSPFKAPRGLTAKSVMAAPKHLAGGKAMSPSKGKLPTLADMKRTIPQGGLLNKGLRQGYGNVPGLDT